MKKCGKTALSLLLSVSMGVATVTPVMASPARGEPELNPLVAVIEKVNSGDTLNLTEEGTLDWVHITGKEINRKSGDEELIQWENLDADSALSTAGDSAMAYTWTDGTPVVEKTNDTHAGVFNYRGIETGVVEEDAGYRISIPAADETRTLTFVSGIWQASAEIGITVNEDEKPVYTTQLKAGGSAEMNKYTVTVREGNEVTITTKIKEKTHKDGNLSLGGIALKTVEPSPIAVKVQDVSSLPKLNLTERGDVDWIHFEGEKGVSQEGVGTTVRKKDVDSQVTYQKLSDDETTTMSDAKVKYTWTDGTPIESAEDNTTGAVFTYKNGDKNSIGEDITSPAGYELKVAPAEYDRELVFVSGVWSADASISIKLDGEETPVYENNELTAGGEGANKVYTVALAAGKGMTVTGQIKKKSNEWGNFNLQAAALSIEKTLNDYKVLLQEKVNEAKALDLADYEEFYANQLNAEIQYAEGLLETESTNAEYYTALLFLTQAYESCLKAETKGSYMYETNSGLTSSFGWEGDKHAPIAYLDGSYKLRDNGNKMVTFGVKDIPGKVKWYNAEGYLPCFVSEYSKDGIDYKIENFANKHTIDGNDYEIAYSRMTVTNQSEEERSLPRVSADLIPLNEEAKNVKKIGAGAVVVRDYAIGADRFGGTYDYPESDKIAAQGGYDENYATMKQYWNDRLAPLTELNLPDEQLVNAYKAGFIYTLIIRDDVNGKKELHVGENGYDIMYDHDTIGIVASLLTEGDFTYAKEYLATLPAQLQYDDAKWKYSWPYALYLSKTGDYDFIREKFDTIKKHTHNVETDRIDDGEGIIKKTNAIDSNGYWLIDNWAALAGLTTYQYLCDEMHDKYGEELYQTESQWAQEEYDSLLAVVEKTQKAMRDTYDYPYLSIDMNVPTEDSARGDVRDGNWASMFLFGRWGWDGYLFGAEQEGSEMIGLIDDTYAHGFERREEVSDTIYNFGGYPHGYYSSAYNAGYGSTALRGEEYRDAGIKAYQFMIQNAMSGPFGWWEGVDYQSDDSPWDVAHAKGGGGSCQHMWGQSTASKVLIDALIAEKINDKIIIGRGVPKEWITANQTFSVSNHVVEQGKKVGYAVQTSPDGKEVTITFTGDQTTIPFSVELINFKNNIASVSGNFEFDQEAGIVTVPAGTKSVTVTLKSAYDKDAAAELEKADKRLKAALSKVQEKEEADYTKTSYEIMKQASDEGEALLEDAERTAVLVNAAAEKTEQAIKNLVPIYVDYDVVDTSGNKEGSAYRVGQKSDQYMRYQTFFANHTGVLEKVEVKVRREKDPSDLIVKVYSLQENHKDLGEELASAVIPAENANGIVRVVFENAPTLNEGEAYAILLGQETPDNSNVYVWSHVENTDSNIFSVKVSNNNGELSYKDETQTIGTAWFRAVIANYNKTKLEEMIQEAEKLDSEEYTEESFANLQKALEEAGNVLANMNADKEMVVGAEESLKTALEALQKADQEADKADLEALIEYANSQKGEEEYQWVVKAVKEAFEKALADAEAVNMNESATQEEVDAAYELLLGRVHLLGFIGNPTNLKVTLDLAKETSTEGKTEESVAILNAAIEKAETLLKTENVLQEEMEAMVAELKAAIEGLKDEVVVEVDKSDLLELIKKAEGCDLTKYTPVTVEGLKTALVGAKEVYDNPDATQKEVDSAYQSLHQAIFGLRLIPNKDALEELIKETEKIDFSLYTEESAATVQKAYNRAKAVFEDKNAVQEEVDKAEKELKVAKDNLVLKDDEDKTPSKDQNTGASSNQKPVQTGDNMSTGALAGIVVAAVLAMGAIAGVMFSKKRKK